MIQQSSGQIDLLTASSKVTYAEDGALDGIKNTALDIDPVTHVQMSMVVIALR